MTQHACACGYQADSADDLTDHLVEVFVPADDTGRDGQAHAEAARDNDTGTPASAAVACLCGYQASGIAELDQHLLTVFTPDDGIGRDGARHTAQRA